MSQSPVLEPVHCRLFCLLARRANTGVIFRRGPSKWVQIIRWDTEQDTFMPGQWFHGRIYEKRCDLSPNGRLMIYFASKFNETTIADKEYTYAWTAISRPPYLTALALWPKGDCWHGGGLFTTNKRVWLNHLPAQAIPHPKHRPRGIEVTDNPNAAGEDDPVYLARLERDGWIFEQPYKLKKEKYGFGTDQPRVYRRSSPDALRTLVMADFIEGHNRRSEFTLRHNGGTTSLSNAEWADWDQRGRLVFMREGKLFAANVDAEGRLHEQELASFDEARFELQKAPDWANRW